MTKVLFYLAATFVLVSCKTVKETTSRETELRDSLQLLESEYNRLYSENLQLQYASILFDTDTLYLRDTVDRLNTVYITKEGEIRTVGKIKEVKVANRFYTKLIEEKNKTIDSLRVVKNLVIEKQKLVKRSYIPFWVWIVMAALVCWNFRKKIVELWNISV